MKLRDLVTLGAASTVLLSGCSAGQESSTPNQYATEYSSPPKDLNVVKNIRKVIQDNEVYQHIYNDKGFSNRELIIHTLDNAIFGPNNAIEIKDPTNPSYEQDRISHLFVVSGSGSPQNQELILTLLTTFYSADGDDSNIAKYTVELQKNENGLEKKAFNVVSVPKRKGMNYGIIMVHLNGTQLCRVDIEHSSGVNFGYDLDLRQHKE